MQKKLAAELKTAQDAAKGAAKKLKETKRDVQVAKEERETLSVEQQQLLKDKTKLELTIKDLTDEVQGDDKSKVSAIIKNESVEVFSLGIFLLKTVFMKLVLFHKSSLVFSKLSFLLEMI